MRAALAGAAVTGAVAIAACGSSSTSTSSGGTGGGSSSSASSGSTGSTGSSSSSSSGGTIKVMALGQFQASTFDYPQGPPAMKAAFAKINAAGGVNGQKIALTVCNDQASPQIALQCARDAVSGKYAAVIGSYSVQAASFLPILQAAGIAYMGQDATQSIEGTSPISFPLESQYQLYSSMGYAAGFNKQCTSAGLITENYGAATATEDNAAAQAFSIASGGGKVVKIVNTGSSLADYSAPIATLESAGAKCIISPMPPTELGKVLQSIAQSSQPDTPLAVTAASLPVSVLKQLGSAANGMMVGSAGYSVDATDNPAINKVVAAVTKSDPSASINSFTIEGYAAAEILAHAMSTIKGTVDAASTMKALGQITNYATGIEPPYTTTKPGPIKGQPRIFSLGITVYKVANQKLGLVSNGFIDLAGKIS